MIEKIKNLICKDSKKKIKELEEMVQELKQDLDARQEVINQTNAYWKRKLYNLQKNIEPKKTKKK